MDYQRSDTPGAAAENAPSTAQYLMFVLGSEMFAMDIRMVREIIQYGTLTPVPLMPPFVRGVLNLRGAVVPVIDLKARFGWSVAEVGKKTCVIIFDVIRNGERVELGLMVDAVSEVIDISSDDIELPPQFGSVIRRDFIQGLSKADGKFIVILDLDSTLDIEQMADAGGQVISA
jgi:purine-binding chemotaxis protein CheW